MASFGLQKHGVHTHVHTIKTSLYTHTNVLVTAFVTDEFWYETGKGFLTIYQMALNSSTFYTMYLYESAFSLH